MTSDILERRPPTADRRLFYGADPLQFGDLRLPHDADEPYPVAVVVHGGYWRARYDLEHTGHVAAALTATGLATWNIEYRRIGNPGGGWPGTFLDAAEAVDHLQQIAPDYRLNLERVVVIGHSAGGHLALWLAARHRLVRASPLFREEPLPIRGVVALAGVADLRRAWELRLSEQAVEAFLGGTPETYPERYDSASPIEQLPIGVPQRLVHGVEDGDVPFEISERYYEAALAAGDDVALISLPGAGHYEPIDPDSSEWPLVAKTVLDLF